MKGDKLLTERGTGQVKILQCMRLAAACAFCAVFGSSLAQSYPNKVVRIVVPYTAGGGTDLVTRIVAENFAQKWGTQVIVDNRPGAGGSIGAEVVARSAADGYTLLVMPLDLVINTALMPNLSYDPIKDYAPISSLVASNLVIAAHPSLGVKSIADLVRKAKSEPGRIAFASCGNGTPQQLIGEMFKLAAGIDLAHVPYKGCGPAQVDAIGGQVPLVITAAGNLVPFFNSGKMVPLAVTGPVRHPQLPEVPTMVESGFAGFTMTNWMALLAPSRTPPEVIARIHTDLLSFFRNPAFTKKIVDRGFEPFPSSPRELRARIERDKEQFAAIVKRIGVKVD